MARYVWSGALVPLTVVSILLLAGQACAQVNVACEGITGIPHCIECSSSPKRCFLCHRNRVPVYNTNGVITSCKAASSSGTACVTASGDPNCALCDGVWCHACKANFAFDANYRCIDARVAANCPKLLGNSLCATCNPDGTCTTCKASTPARRVMPMNARYINAGFPLTECKTVAEINAEAQRVTYANAFLPSGCISVDTEFKCDRCLNGQSLVNGVCRGVTTALGSKCSTSLPYYQYCARCDPANNMRCVSCNGGRGLVGGQCSLPCRMLYGIGCKNCNATKCLTRDANYANGRR